MPHLCRTSLLACCTMLAIATLALCIWAQHILDGLERGGDISRHRQPLTQAVAGYGSGMATLLVALLLARKAGLEPERVEPVQLQGQAELWTAGAVGLLALAFRLWYVDTIPFGLNNDAAWYGSQAIDMTHGAPFTFYTDLEVRHDEVLYIYTVALAQQLFGYTGLAIKASSTLYAILLLPLLYGFARRLLSPCLAVLTIGLAATSWYAVLYARSGWRVMSMPVFELAAAWALWEADQCARHWRKIFLYAVAGLAGGLALHTYNAARVLPVFFATYLLYRAASARGWLRANAWGLGLFAIIVSLMAAPLVHVAVTRPDHFWARFHTTPVRSWTTLGNNLLCTAGLFHFRANGNDWFVHEPLLEPPLNWFFPLGLAALLARIGQPRSALLLLYFLTMLVPGIASVPNGNRTLGVLPVVMLCGALGLTSTIGLLTVLLPQKVRQTTATLIIGATLITSAIVCAGRHLRSGLRYVEGVSADKTNAVLALRNAAPPDARYYLTLGSVPYAMARYLLYPGDGTIMYQAGANRYFAEVNPADMVQVDPGDRAAAFLLDEWHPATGTLLNVLRSRFPIHTYLEIPSLYQPHPRRWRIFVVPSSVPPGESELAKDPDGDGIPDALELPNATAPFPAQGTNRWLTDSDGDALSDGLEDANRNGRRDAGELDPRSRDSDGDQFEDGLEQLLLASVSLDPASPGGTFLDSDGDRLPDARDPNASNPDTDGDRFDDLYDAVCFASIDAVKQADRRPPLADCTGDGAITNLDALVVQSLFLGLLDIDHAVFHTPNPEYRGYRWADANFDAVISNVDALVMQGFFLRQYPTLPLRR